MFKINLSEYPPSCLPDYIDEFDLIDVTRIGDSWKRYLEPNTGKEHDCKKYYDLYMDSITNESK